MGIWSLRRSLAGTRKTQSLFTKPTPNPAPEDTELAPEDQRGPRAERLGEEGWGEMKWGGVGWDEVGWGVVGCVHTQMSP